MIDWKPGDLAQCIEDTDEFGRNIGLQLLNIYTVASVAHDEVWCLACQTLHDIIGLTLVEVESRGGHIGWDHRFFRKVDPIQLDEDEEITQKVPTKEPELA